MHRCRIWIFVWTLLAFFRHARLDEALVWSAPLLVTGGMSLKFPKHPVLAAFWGLWGLYTLVLTPFLFLSARKVLVFFVGDLILTGVLIISTLRIREREKDNE